MSTDTRPVVVGLLDNDNPAVLMFALDEARRLGADLRVVHVLAPGADDEQQAAATQLFDAVRQVADTTASEVTVELVRRDGDATQVLETESGMAARLVLGADDHSWLARIVGNDIAVRLASRAAAPVIVVPVAPAVGLPDANQRAGVVVAIDDPGDADGLLRYALEAAEARGEALQVIHSSGVTSDYIEREQQRYRLDEVVDGWRAHFPNVKIFPTVDVGHPVGACTSATGEASLLVLGRPVGPHPRIASRAVAARVLRRASVPVAVVPLDYGQALLTN